MSRKTSQRGVDLIKRWEGCKLNQYLDQHSIKTIGYGHTGVDVVPGLSITPDQAEELLKKDLEAAEKGVDTVITVLLNDNEFAALVCFTFNIGVNAFKMSTLRTILNQGNRKGAADQFLRWNHISGVESQGLTNRRIAERALFLEPIDG